MSRSTPSLLALLGLVAYAGYQNRGKIGEMLSDARAAQPPAMPGAGGSLLSGIGQMFQSGNAGSTLAGGLSDLVNRFKTAGHGHAADSWVASGANLPVHTTDLESALGDDTLVDLEQKTGLARPELLRRLSTSLPDIVDQLTPEGRLPTASEAGRIGSY
ncbi:MAG: YidB family protein [Paracoccaceae bacterium]